MGSRRKPETGLAVLGPEHETAIELLITGKSVEDAGEAIGLAVSEVAGWRSDPAFVAAWNRRRERQWGEQQDQLRALVPRALAVVEAALDQGDAKTALALLRLAGLGRVDLSEIGPKTPEGVEMREYLQESRDRYG